MAAYVQDTIAAIATAVGPGAMSVLRLSGVEARSMAEDLLRNQEGGRLDLDATHRARHGRLVRPEDQTIIDDVLVLPMWGPRSYTGEDTVEIHCHGGRVIADLALRAALAAGARSARAGEFTERAYLNGRLDLCQAEAVAEVIAAGSETALVAARRTLDGELSAVIAGLRDRLLDARALTEAHLDFPEEDLPSSVAEELTALLAQVQSQVVGLERSYQRGRLVRDGARVVLVGRPNAGKSSLLNALLGRDRALVSDEAGTTRDYLEEPLDLGGHQTLLCDTAGLREAESRIEQAGVERTRDQMRDADVVVFLVDGSETPNGEDLALLTELGPEKTVCVRSKCDLPQAWSDDSEELGTPFLSVSARDRVGLESLQDAIVGRLPTTPSVGSGLMITNARHHEALRRSRAPLDRAADLVSNRSELELVSAELQVAGDALGEILGKTDSEDVLDRIFSRFCVGK